MSDADTLARTCWAEARGDGREGMEAAAATIANRVATARRYRDKWGTPHVLYGDGTFSSACKRRFQFSCWNANDPNLPKLLSVTAADPEFRLATEIANEAVAGTLADPTDGATHYLTKEAFDKAPDDHWCKRKPPLCTIGHHIFFRNP